MIWAYVNRIMILTCLKCLQLHLFLAALQQFQEFPKDSRCLSEIFATVSSFHQLSIGRIFPSRWGLTAPIWPMSSMSLASTQLYPTGWSLVTWQNGRMSSQVLPMGTTSEATRALEWWSTIHFIAMMSPRCLSICSHLAVLVCCVRLQSPLNWHCVHLHVPRARCSRQVPELHEIKRGDGNALTLGAACTLSTLIEDKTDKTPRHKSLGV